VTAPTRPPSDGTRSTGTKATWSAARSVKNSVGNSAPSVPVLVPCGLEQPVQLGEGLDPPRHCRVAVDASADRQHDPGGLVAVGDPDLLLLAGEHPAQRVDGVLHLLELAAHPVQVQDHDRVPRLLVGGGEHREHIVDRQVQVPQPTDQPGLGDLLGPVVAVATARVAPGRLEQPDVVVVPDPGTVSGTSSTLQQVANAVGVALVGIAATTVAVAAAAALLPGRPKAVSEEQTQPLTVPTSSSAAV
jgi:hypothetical protein